jgi:hypothetical protein
MASVAPLVSMGHRQNDMFAAFHISESCWESTWGSPWPPKRGSPPTAAQPASTNWR